MRQLRQGDILVERLDHLPDGHKAGRPDIGGTETTVIVLSKGEATGHAHRLEMPAGSRFDRAADRRDPFAIGVAVLAAPAAITHDEHAAVTLPPGVWRFSRQRRFDPTLHARAVAD